MAKYRISSRADITAVQSCSTGTHPMEASENIAMVIRRHWLWHAYNGAGFKMFGEMDLSASG